MVKRKTTSITRLFCFIVVVLFFSCKGQKEEERKTTIDFEENADKKSINSNFNQNTILKEKHSDLNGMVTEFIRKMYQDKNGNFWFGTNGDGIIRYDKISLEEFDITKNFNRNTGAVRGIAEDEMGNIWFGTSSGLIKFEDKNFEVFSKNEGLDSDEIWGLTIDNDGLIWLGTAEGIYQYDGENFTNFPLPKSIVKNPKPMLSEKLVFKILEDQYGKMWFVTDGNGIYTYQKNSFKQLTDSNGLTDNNAFDIFEDSKGNIWIGTFNGGVSKYDGRTFTNFTKDGLIEGPEVYNFIEDKKGNIWFSAENHGVYRYDGKVFTQFTTEDGLASNTIQSIYEDNKEQIWFGTWEGISLYDGKEITNVSDKVSWTK